MKHYPLPALLLLLTLTSHAQSHTAFGPETGDYARLWRGCGRDKGSR